MDFDNILPPLEDITDKQALASLNARDEITTKISMERIYVNEEITEKSILPEKDLNIYGDTQPVFRNGQMLRLEKIKSQSAEIRRAKTEDIPPDLLIHKTKVPQFHQQWIDMSYFWKKLLLTLRMIKVQHSIFALPFALSSVFVATNGNPSIISLIMVILAMVTARNTAMSFNRIVDRDIDGLNPRTKNREIPSGKLSTKFALIFCLVNSLLFVFISSYFNILTLLLSPLALAIIMGYSLTKRFTHYTQIFLGIALGITPIAAWIAMTGSISAFSIFLGLGVLCWVAGFDVIYSTLDYDFDKIHDLKNMVVKLGIKKSLLISRILHLFSITFLILGGVIQGLQSYYLIGCLIVAALLLFEHSLVKAKDLSKVNMAFFTLNGYISLLFFIFVLLEVYL